MSSYVNFFLKTKETGEYMLLDSFTRNSKMYGVVEEIIRPPFVYDKDAWRDLTAADFHDLDRRITTSIGTLKDNITDYRRCVYAFADWYGSPDDEKPKTLKEESVADCVERMNELKEECSELEAALSFVRALGGIDFAYGGDFCGVAVNIT